MSLWKHPIPHFNYVKEIAGFHLTIADIKKLNPGDSLKIVCFDHNIDTFIDHILLNKTLSANTFYKELHQATYTHISGLYGTIQIKDYDIHPKYFEFSIECCDCHWFPLEDKKVHKNIYDYTLYPEYYNKSWIEFPDTTRIGIYDISANIWNGPIVLKKHMKYFPKVYRQNTVLLHQQIINIVNSV